jgi:hypothetical protein
LFTFREHVHYLDKCPWDLRDVDDRVGDRQPSSNEVLMRLIGLAVATFVALQSAG